MDFPHQINDSSDHHTKNSVGAEERWIKHYSSSHKILLVGEGDFSFAATLAQAFGSASNITATSIEYKKKLTKVYRKAADNIQHLQSKGANVWHAVDAISMASHPSLKNRVFDRIVFNFPFAEVSQEEWNNLHLQTVLKKQQSLVTGFLENAKKMIGENGEIHITHRKDGCFGAWRIKFLASKQGLELVQAVDFNICDYPGYNAKWGNGTDVNFESRLSKTYKFRLPCLPLVEAELASPSPSNHCGNHILKNDYMRQEMVEDCVAEAKWLEHYCSSHKILLVGEGDFSFAASLAEAFGSASNITATSLDYKNDLRKVYSKAADNIQKLQTKGCKVWHAVDATAMASHPSLKNLVFDRIVFNFPFAVISQEEWSNLHLQPVLKKQQSLVAGFLENAKKMIGEDGEIHITHRTDQCFGAWRIKFLASNQGLELVEVVGFNICDYPLYNAKCGNGSDDNFESFPSKTYKFRLPRLPLVEERLASPSPSNYSSNDNLKHDYIRQEMVEDFVEEEKWLKHYCSSHKILLVGEGDFSFSASLAMAFGSASNMIATSLDSRRALRKVHKKAAHNIQELVAKGGKVLPSVDATAIASHPILKGMVFDRIVFNFPCTAISQNDCGALQLQKHQSLVREFLQNSKKMIGEKGEIHITHRIDGVFGSWRIKFIASMQGLQLVEAVDFNICDYPGYFTKWGNGSDENFQCFPSKIYKFCLPRPPATTQANTYLAEQPEDFYDFTEKRSYANQELPCGVAASSSSSDTAQFMLGVENRSPTKLLKSFLLEQKEITSPPKRNDFANYNLQWDDMEPEKVMGVVAEEKWVKHYSSSHKMLLVGEGDFSFSASLAAAFGSAVNMTATSLESKTSLRKLYGKSVHNIKELKSKGCKVLHAVDATSMASLPCFKDLVFDRIVFNFPYAAIYKNCSYPQIRKHQSLVKKFMENSKQMIDENGEIHVTHRTDGVFGSWRIKALASKQGLEFVEATDFNSSDYPGYNPKCDYDDFERFPSKTYKFRLSKHPSKTKTVSSAPSEPSNISVEDVCTMFPSTNTNLAEQWDEFYYGCPEELTSPSLFPKSNFSPFKFDVENYNAAQDEVTVGITKLLEAISLEKKSSATLPEPASWKAVPNPREMRCNLFENELYLPPPTWPVSMAFPYGEDSCSPVYAAAQNQHDFLASRMYSVNQNMKQNEMQQEKWIKHYSSHQKILLVGEGDFSFSACLAVAFGSAANMTATSLDSEDFLTTNYCKAFLHLKELKNRGCKVMHGVDATSMIHTVYFMGSKFDRIIFNFPYAGFFKDIPRPSQLCCHQSLIRLFLVNAKQMIDENGEIHITHKTNGFHKEWSIVSIAIQEGLELVSTVDFNLSDYPGYSNKYGFGGDNNFQCSPSQTYMFRLPRTMQGLMALQCGANYYY